MNLMSYQCYLLLFTPILLQVMSYQCYFLVFTPFVLQEVHALSMLFVIIYYNCFAITLTRHETPAKRME
jgi:hypothetical protein